RRQPEVVRRGGKEQQRRGGEVFADEAANHGLAITPRIPRKADARSNLPIAVGDHRRVETASTADGELCVLDERDQRIVADLGIRVLLLLKAQPVVERQVRTEAPRVLREDGGLRRVEAGE